MTCRWRSCWHCWHSAGRSPFAPAAWSVSSYPHPSAMLTECLPSLRLPQSACPHRGYNLQWHWPAEKQIVKRKLFSISILDLDTGFRAASSWLGRAWTKVEDVIRVAILILRDRHSNLRLNRHCILLSVISPTSWLIRLWSFWILATSRSFSLLISLDFSFRTEFCDSSRSTFDFTYLRKNWEMRREANFTRFDWNLSTSSIVQLLHPFFQLVNLWPKLLKELCHAKERLISCMGSELPLTLAPASQETRGSAQFVDLVLNSKQ